MVASGRIGRCPGRRLAFALSLLLGAGLYAHGGDGERFVRLADLTGVTADWVTIHGDRFACGSSTELVVGRLDPLPRIERRLRTDSTIDDAVMVRRRLFLVLDSSRLAMLDPRDPLAQPREVRLEPAPRGRLSIAVAGGRVGIAEDGAGVRLLQHGGGFALPAEVPVEPRIRSRFAAGRLVYVAAGAEGLITYRNITPESMTIPVTVANDFFTPAVISVDPGDTVEWSNAFGFHNVYSCNPGQVGCSGFSVESFDNGPPSVGPWVFTHTFTLPGSNPYVCQSHAPDMAGVVVVAAPETGPPAVPDGTNGEPMRVTRMDPRGRSLRVSWDTGTCPGGIDHQILWGNLVSRSLGGFSRASGSLCSVGPSGAVVWDTPPLTLGTLLWWIVVATDGQTTEGSWGMDSEGRERSGPASGGSSGMCGVVDKDLSNTCGR